MADEQASYEAGSAEYVPHNDDDGSGQSDGEVASEKGLILEQDRLLPLANIGRIMKKVLPDAGKLSKDAKECMQECVSEFLLFIASEASDLCSSDSRKTLSGDDIIAALAKLGFDNYVEPSEAYLRKYREAINGKSAADEAAGRSTLYAPAAVPEPVEYGVEPKFQHHPHHSQHHSQHVVQNVQHHGLAVAGGPHPQAVHVIQQQQQYVSQHPQQFQPAGYAAGGQSIATGPPVDVTAVAGPSTMPQADGAVSAPELQEVNFQSVQVFNDPRTGQHYLRISDGNYVPIAFLTNQGVPPPLVAGGGVQPQQPRPVAIGQPPAKVARTGRLPRGGGRGSRAGHDDADAGGEQSVGSYLRRQQQKLNPTKRAGK